MWETKYTCQHLPKVDRWPWVAKTTSTGARVWKDTGARVRNKCKPYSKKQGGSRKKTKCCVFRYPHQLPFVVRSLRVNVLTPGKTRKQHILGMQITPMLNKECNLNKDSCHPATRSRLRALTPLASHKKGDVIGSLSCRMQCVQS